MKQLLIAIALLLGMIAATAHAVTVEEITVDWSFDTQGVSDYAPESVSLFSEGQQLCNQPADGTETGTFTCRGVEVLPGERAFTIAIQMANGRESPHSAPYMLTIPTPDPLEPAIIEFYLRVTVDGQVHEFTNP